MTKEKAYVAGGCFWGVEYYMQKLPGIISTRPGYSGGHTENPTYEDVCSGSTGHYETVEIVFDPKKISYEEIIKLFMEIHDPEQADGQGPDIGSQYRSAIFFTTERQKETARKLISFLLDHGVLVKTELLPFDSFWSAEAYHVNYYDRKGSLPYCHGRVKRFDS